MLERFDLERPIAVRDFHAQALARGERHHLVGGKFPLDQDSISRPTLPVAPTTATL